MDIPGTVLLAGIVGSTAYGMAHGGSDIDRLGMYAAPTERWHGLTPPTINELTWSAETKPDRVMHEALKVVSLALVCNPTVTELLWLPGALYEVRTPLGDELIGLRESLVSAPKVKDSYLRYAQRQFARLKARGDGSFSSDTRKRTAKHARHLYRLLMQGCNLHQTGHLTVRLSPDQATDCRAFGEFAAAGETWRAEEALRDAEAMFDKPGVLPGKPDEAAAEAWLLQVRAAMWERC